MNNRLALAMQLAASAQFGVACLNFFLPSILHWKGDIARMPLLLREVFQVHAWFISITLMLFAAITWRFARELATGTEPLGQWLCWGIGIFWAIRATLQVAYYSKEHWRGIAFRTAIHVILLTAYSALALLYMFAAFRPLF